MNRKGNKILYIGDGITTLLKIKNFYVFEDNWLSEYDTILEDSKGNEYNVIEFKTTEDYVCTDKPRPMAGYFPWRWVKRSCVKLNKEVEIGELLYGKEKRWEDR